jgi:hypothetical protein
MKEPVLRLSKNGRAFPPNCARAAFSRVVRPLAIVLTLTLLFVGMWLERNSLLRSAADLWIVSDPITPGDAVVVLGGGLGVRPFVAADLYRRGIVSKIVVSQVAEERFVDMGVIPGHAEINRKILLQLGVPDTAIETFGIANKNTADEAASLKDWASRNATSVLIIPTEIFSARRVRWIFRHEFSEKSVRIEVPSFEPERYNRAEWWKTEDGMIAFQNEVLKYIYYRVKY